MANHKGSEGVVKVGSNTIAEVKNWQISEKSDVMEDTTMGDTAKTFQASLTEWEGSLSCFWDETDTNGQQAMTIGASITLNLYPEGATSGDTYYTGTALITSIERSANHDGMVESSFSFKGTGALTKTTVV